MTLARWNLIALIGLCACQFENRCGEDKDLKYMGGLCIPRVVDAGPPPPPVVNDAGGDSMVADPGCIEVCTLVKRCIGDNAQASALLGPELTALGLEASGAIDGCVDFCAMRSAGAENNETIGCLADANGTVPACSDLMGALTAAKAVSDCCNGRKDSTFCVDVCTVLTTREEVSGVVSSCPDLVK